MSEDEFEEAHENGGEPVALDINDDPAFVHACIVENSEGEEIDVVHLAVAECLGVCDFGEEHYKDVVMLFTPAEAFKLAGALIAAADTVAGTVLGSAEEPSGD